MSKSDHQLKLLPCFVALLLLTAAEVGLFETWHRIPAFHDKLPKFALVLLILVFTIPKAAIVMIFFMHLKFEKFMIVLLALVPFVMASLAVLPTLTDNLTIKPRLYNQAAGLGQYVIHHGDHEGEDTHATPAASGHEAEHEH